jgi:uroporphyrinogen-III synthase
VTRASDQSDALESALRAFGLEPVVVPTISVEIDPPGGRLDAAARELDAYTWVVVTSANGAKAIVTAAQRVSVDLRTASWAAIGGATASVLERNVVEVRFRPSRADAQTLATQLPLHAGRDVLLLRGNLADDLLPERLRDRGATVTDVVAYRTIEGPAPARAILRDALAAGRPDAVLFASGSAARGLVALAEAELDVMSIPAICIGPETARETARLGFRVLATSPVADVASLAATTAATLPQPMETR